MGYSLDERYLNALRDRDPQAEDDLVRSFAHQIESSVRKQFPSFEMAEDARQETLLRVLLYFRAGKTLRAPSSLPGFVKSVSTFVSLEMLRARGGSPDPNQLSEAVDSAANPENAALCGERTHIVECALRKLDERDALLLRRVFLEGVERGQLCREMQVSHDYLRVMVHRAKLRFKSAVLITDKQRHARAKRVREQPSIARRHTLAYPY